MAGDEAGAARATPAPGHGLLAPAPSRDRFAVIASIASITMVTSMFAVVAIVVITVVAIAVVTVAGIAVAAETAHVVLEAMDTGASGCGTPASAVGAAPRRPVVLPTHVSRAAGAAVADPHEERAVG